MTQSYYNLAHTDKIENLSSKGPYTRFVCFLLLLLPLIAGHITWALGYDGACNNLMTVLGLSRKLLENVEPTSPGCKQRAASPITYITGGKILPMANTRQYEPLGGSCFLL